MNYTEKITVCFKESVSVEDAKTLLDAFEALPEVQFVAPIANKFDLIREWANQKGILDNGDAKTQTIKLLEEAGELAAAVLRDNRANAIDAIGDIVVVLTSLAHFADTTIEECITAAYDVIKSRTGKMVKGDFQKDA